MVGKGQPPKAPEDKRKKSEIFFSPKEREVIEEAREIESPDRRFGAYIRDVTLDHVKQVVKEKKNKK